MTKPRIAVARAGTIEPPPGYRGVTRVLGTVEGLTIRTVRLRDIDGIVHTIPFSEIKSIKNYSREFGYAIFRVAVPYNMEIDDAIKLMREVGQKMRTDPLQRRNIWSPLEFQGVESFESGSAVLRARFKTAPIKQWEVSRAFNLALKRQLDEAGLDLATPRLSVQVVTAGGGPAQDTAPVDTNA